MTELPSHSTADFDYSAPAGVFTRMRYGRGGTAKYRRFNTAAEAIRYAIEELPTQLLPGITMEVGEETLDHQQIMRLYEDPRFPLAPVAARDAAAN